MTSIYLLLVKKREIKNCVVQDLLNSNEGRRKLHKLAHAEFEINLEKPLRREGKKNKLNIILYLL